MITLKTHKAQVYALYKHSGQEYGLGVPYSVHLTYVVMNAIKFLHNIADDDKENVIVACYLHDILEDAIGVSFNDLNDEFGEVISEMVYSVTNELGHNRKEKSEKTLPKTAKNRLSVFIKLCDKIANTEYSKMTKSRMYKQYAKEHSYFKEMLYRENEYSNMWDYLEHLNNDALIIPAEIMAKTASSK